MKKTLFAVRLSAALAAAALGLAQPLLAAPRTDGSEIIDLTTEIASKPLTGGVVYRVTANGLRTFTGNGAGGNGLTVADGQKVVICVEPATSPMKATGADAGQGSDSGGGAGAGAGICIPSSSSLYIIGGGSVQATGGANGLGQNGAAGQAGLIMNKTTKKPLGHNTPPNHYNDDLDFTSGGGGKGGAAGGGAGAGIGGNGGKGGNGGGGTVGRTHNWNVSPKSKFDEAGDEGKGGGGGENGSASGDLYVLAGSVVGTAGTCTETRSAGGGYGTWSATWASGGYRWGAFGGGGGGGGGYGGSAAGIGGGGGGGGGGGSGGGGATRYKWYGKSLIEQAGAGLGGTGVNGGGGGTEIGESVTLDGNTFAMGNAPDKGPRGGKAGDGGANGAMGASGKVYVDVDAGAQIPDKAVEREKPSSSESGVYTLVTFDHNKGKVNGAEKSLWAFMVGKKETDPVLSKDELPTRGNGDDYSFNGYYDSNRRKYIDENGRQTCIWNLPPGATLTAEWNYHTAYLTVNTNEDKEHDEESGKVSLRDAIKYISDHKIYIKNQKVTPMISFLGGSKGVQSYKLSKPLVIPSDILSELGLVIDGAYGRGDEDAVYFMGGEGITTDGADVPVNLELRNLHFAGLNLTENPSALSIPRAGNVVVENCRFQECSVGNEGAPITIDNLDGSLTVSRCSFVQNSGDAFASAIYVKGWTSGFVNVLRSTFSGNNSTVDGGAPVIDTRAPTLVANCTFVDNPSPASIWSTLLLGEDSAVASTVFSGNKAGVNDVYCSGPLRMAYVYARGWQSLSGEVSETNCVRGADRSRCVKKPSGDDTKPQGVLQDWFIPGEDLAGGYLLHDEGYTNVMVLASVMDTSDGFLLRGGPQGNGMMLDLTDQCGERFPEENAAAGSVAALAYRDLQTVMISSANLLDRFDGAISLADAFYYAGFHGTGGPRTIGFADSVGTVAFFGALAVTTNAATAPLDVTVDGVTNRTSGRAVTFTGSGASAGLVFGRGVAPTLRNLRFENFRDTSVTGCAVRIEGDLGATVLNCVFSGSETDMPVLAVDAAGGLLEVKRCSFVSNNVRKVGCPLLEIRGGELRMLSSVFGGNSSRGPALSLDGVDALLAGLTFADNLCWTNILMSAGERSSVLCDLLFDGQQYMYTSADAADVGALPAGSVLSRVYGRWTESPGVTVHDDCVRPAAGGSSLVAGVRRMDVSGVPQVIYEPAPNAIGGFIWHSDDWSAVALSRRRNGKGLYALRGVASKAVLMYDDDQSGDGGKYSPMLAPTVGAYVVMTSENLRFVTLAEDRDERGQHGLSLREALTEPCDDEDGEPCLVTFDRKLPSVALTNTIVVGEGTFPSGVIVDGFSGRADSGAIVIRPADGATTDSGAILFGEGNLVELDHLVFDGFSSHARGSALTFDACDAAGLENCVFRNCTAEGEGGAAVHGRDVVGLLEISRCTFASNAAERGFAAVSAKDGGGSCLLATTVTGNSGQGAVEMDDLATVIHCSFADNACSGTACLRVGAESNVVVNTIFDRTGLPDGGREIVAPDDGFPTALAHVYGSWTGNCTTDDGCETNPHGYVLLGVAKTEVFDGVPHIWHAPALEMIAAQVSYSTNAWSTVAVAKDSTALQAVLRGGETNLSPFDWDLTGSGDDMRYCDRSYVPSAGSVVVPLKTLFRVTRVDDGAPCRCDGQISLREAVDYMATYGSEFGPPVTFADEIDTINISSPIGRTDTVNHEVRIDGFSGRSAEKASVRMVSSSGCDGFAFGGSNDVSFANLAFSGFAGGEAGHALVLDPVRRANVLNCSFTTCGSSLAPAVAANVVGGGRLELSRCSVVRGGQFLDAAGEGAVAVLSTTFSGNSSFARKAGDSLCVLKSDFVVLGGVTFTGNSNLVYCVDASTPGSSVAVCDGLFGENATLAADLNLARGAALSSCYGTWDGEELRVNRCERMVGRSYVSADALNANVAGVRHVWYRADVKAEGCFLWHNDAWTDVASSSVSRRAQTSDKWPMFGSAENAALVVSDDELVAGKYLAVAQPCSGAVVEDLVEVKLLVDTEEDSPNPSDGRNSLRKALAFAVEIGRNACNTIRFDPRVKVVTITNAFEIAKEMLTEGLVIDGAAGRGSEPAVILSGGGNVNGFEFAHGNNVTFSNLVMQAFVNPTVSPIGSLVDHEGSADLTFANCLVCGCENANEDGSVIRYVSRQGQNMLRVFNSSFTANKTAGGASVLKMVAEEVVTKIRGGAVLYSDFVGNEAGKGAPAVVLAGLNNVIAGCLFFNNIGGGFSVDGGGLVCATLAGPNLVSSGGADASVDFSSPTNVTMDRVYFYGYRSGSARPEDQKECFTPKKATDYLRTGSQYTVRGVPREARRPAMNGGKPKAPGRFLMSKSGLWSSDDMVYGDALDTSRSHVAIDLVGQTIVPYQLPAAGSVFYDQKVVIEPVVTTTEAESDTDVTLTEAIEYAMTHEGANTVTFDKDLFTPGGTTTFKFENPITVSNVVGGATLTVLGPENATALIAYPRETRRTRFLYIQEPASVLLENLAVSNMQGIAAGVSKPSHKDWETCGGAVLTFGSFTAVNCLFSRCAAGSSDEGQVSPTGDGGAVCAVGKEGKAHFENCIFSLCKALNGGAIASMDGPERDGVPHPGANVTADACVFVTNEAYKSLGYTGYGGAAFRDENSKLAFSGNCRFIGNISWTNGVPYCDAAEVVRDAAGRIVISQLKTGDGTAESGPIYLNSAAPLVADSAAVAQSLVPRIVVTGKPWYTATAEDAAVRFVLNEKATPVIGDFDLGAVSSAAGPVRVSVENGKPNLRYALGWSESPAGDFAAHLTEEDWISADAYGRVGPLTAPKGGDGRFYRLLVRPE